MAGSSVCRCVFSLLIHVVAIPVAVGATPLTAPVPPVPVVVAAAPTLMIAPGSTLAPDVDLDLLAQRAESARRVCSKSAMWIASALMKTIAAVGLVAALLLPPCSAVAANPVWKRSSVSPLVRQTTDLGPAPASEIHRIVV